MNCSQRKLKYRILCCLLYQVPEDVSFDLHFHGPFWLSEVKAVGTFFVLTFCFFFLSFAIAAILQIHPEAQTPITVSWGGFTDMSSLGV